MNGFEIPICRLGPHPSGFGGAMIHPWLDKCPFCGGNADYEEVTPEKYPVTTWGVVCMNPHEDCIACISMKTFATRAEAAEAWNKRVVIIDQPVQRIDEPH